MYCVGVSENMIGKITCKKITCKCCFVILFWSIRYPPLWTHDGRTRSSVTSVHWFVFQTTHPLQSRWALNGSAPVFTRVARWRAIWNETPIIHIRPTDSAILQPHYCRQAGGPFQSPPPNLTSAPSLTTFRQRLETILFWRSYLT